MLNGLGSQVAPDVALGGTVGGTSRTPDEADLWMVFEMIPHIVWLADRDGVIEYFNRRAGEYVGVPAGTYWGSATDWLAVVHPDDVDRTHDAWLKMVSERVEVELSYRIRRADGVYRWQCTRAVPVHDAAGNLVRWIGTCTDVDEQKTLEADLRQMHRETAQSLLLMETLQTSAPEHRRAQEFRSVVMDNMAEGLFTTDKQGRLTSFNRAATGLLGWTEEEILGRAMHEVLHSQSPDGAPVSTEEGPLEQVRASGEPVENVDVMYARKDGSVLPVRYSAAPLHVGDDVAGAVVVFRDATEQRRQQQQSVEDRHDQTLESLGRLSAGLAHEINTPIQFVGDNTRFLAEAYQQMLELLLVYRSCMGPDSGQLPWEARKQMAEDAEEVADIEYLASEVPSAVEQSLEGIERVASLVKAMKAFSYKDTKDRAYADLNEAIRTTVIVARNEVKYVADVVLDLTEIPEVLCHAGDLNQVFLNLLVNAADAMEGREGRGELRVSTRVEDRTVVISFADDGMGIPEEIQKTIFEPFFTTKEVGKGTGQGLALAAAVCEKHGGTIEVDSKVGEGTTFTLRLPIAGKREPA